MVLLPADRPLDRFVGSDGFTERVHQIASDGTVAADEQDAHFS